MYILLCVLIKKDIYWRLITNLSLKLKSKDDKDEGITEEVLSLSNKRF